MFLMHTKYLNTSMVNKVMFHICQLIICRKLLGGAGKISQWLTALVACAKDEGSILSTHTVSDSRLQVWFQGICCPLWPLHEMGHT